MDQLKLQNQICFPFYVTSRLITRAYQPFLDELGITYPQYLVMLVLWEKDGVSVNDITEKLILNTNTITPLLKRMDTLGLITRSRSREDERKVIIKLTDTGAQMKDAAASIPEKLMAQVSPHDVNIEELVAMKIQLQNWIDFLKSKEKEEA